MKQIISEAWNTVILPPQSSKVILVRRTKLIGLFNYKMKDIMKTPAKKISYITLKNAANAREKCFKANASTDLV